MNFKALLRKTLLLFNVIFSNFILHFSRIPNMTIEQNWTDSELVECCHEEVENVLKFRLSQKQYHYLLDSLAEIIDTMKSIRFDPQSILWLNEETDIETVDHYLSTKYSTPLKAKGTLSYFNVESMEEETQEIDFDLTIDMWFNFDPNKPVFNFSILDQKKKLLKDYIEAIHQMSKSHEIISNHKLPKQFDGKNATTFFIDITRMTKNRGIITKDFDVFDDIARCHQDIVICLGEILISKPFISDFTRHPTNAGDKTVYSYFPSIYDKHYLAGCSRAIELLYNFWDKIGDIIAKYLTPAIPEKQVYFSTVCDSMKSFDNHSLSRDNVQLSN